MRSFVKFDPITGKVLGRLQLSNEPPADHQHGDLLELTEAEFFSAPETWATVDIVSRKLLKKEP